MKLKTVNAAKKPNLKKNKSPKKQGKGVEVRKEKSKVVVKPTVLKNEADKTKVESPISPHKTLQQNLWFKAIDNVSNKTDLSDVENSIIKLLAGYKNKNSVPQRSTKFKNFISKGFSKFKDTSDEVLDGVYGKLIDEYKAIGGEPEKKKSDSKKVTKPTKKAASDEEDDEEVGDDVEIDDEVDDDDDDDDDEIDPEIMLGLSDEDNADEESEEEKPKPKAKGNKANNKNGKGPNKGKNGSTKFKGGKVQKNKKFGKKK